MPPIRLIDIDHGGVASSARLSERGGTVTAVYKTAGQAVDTGDLLVELS